MSNLKFSSELLADFLFRAGEATDGNSDFNAQALVYLNRAYRVIYMGGMEFDPQLHEDWWWLKGAANLILQPSIKTGTCLVTNNSTAITFSSAPAVSVAGYYFKATKHADVFKIATHTAATTAATLDSVYTGDTDATSGYRLTKLEYPLASDTIKIMSPMQAYRNSPYKIFGMALSEMEQIYPLHLMESGTPTRFAQVDETNIRFNKYGDDDGELIRVDYDYMKRPVDLTNSASEEPLIPLQYRHLLSDVALFFLWEDKNDDRAANTGIRAKAGIKAMVNENRSRWANIGEAGQIKPRANPVGQTQLRTQSGLLIG